MTTASDYDILARAPALRFLVVGDVMLDHYVTADVCRLSHEAPVPVALATRDDFVPGGAANVAVNLAALGAQAVLAGRIGPDAEGDRLAAAIRRHGVQFIELPPLARTISKMRVIAHGHHLCRVDREDPPAPVDAAAVLAALAPEIRRCDAILLSDYAKGLLEPALLAALIRAARAAGKFIGLDPKPTPRRALDLRGADLMMPNRHEAALLAGVDWAPGQAFPLADVLRALYVRHGVPLVVLTLSEDGMALGRAGQLEQSLPARFTPAPGQFANTCGAGDTALAAMVLALAAGAAPGAAMDFANIAAGLACGKPGTAAVTALDVRARHCTAA